MQEIQVEKVLKDKFVQLSSGCEMKLNVVFPLKKTVFPIFHSCLAVENLENVITCCKIAETLKQCTGWGKKATTV